VARRIPTIAADDISGNYEAVRYAASLGHTRLLMLANPTRRGRETAQSILDRVRGQKETADCRIDLVEPASGFCDYTAGVDLLKYWLCKLPEERPTLVLASDQALTVFLKGLYRKGYKCPEDVSVISGCETLLCETFWPPLTSISCDLRAMAELAVEMLVAHLDKDEPLRAEMSVNDYPSRLIIRESCVRIGTGD